MLKWCKSKINPYPQNRMIKFHITWFHGTMYTSFWQVENEIKQNENEFKHISYILHARYIKFVDYIQNDIATEAIRGTLFTENTQK